MAAGTIFCDVNVDDNASSGILTSYSHCHNNFLNLSHQSCAFIPVAGSLPCICFRETQDTQVHKIFEEYLCFTIMQMQAYISLHKLG